MLLIDFYTAKDISDMFGMKTTVAAIKLMKEWGVPCYFLGAGRKRGYRWKRTDVLQALQAREVTDLPRKNQKAQDEPAEAFWEQEISKIKQACSKVGYGR